MSNSTQRVAVGSLMGYLGEIRQRLETRRIREHLLRTERALRAADYDHLEGAGRRRRERTLERLAAYREAETFPTNRSESERVSLFVGDDGVPCAVAHLLLEAGREDIVDEVMATDPTARIEEVPDEHPLIEFVEENGLTRAEAARIQPTYPEGVQFATTCGPVACWVAGAVTATVGTAVFAAAEYVGYRVASGLFPDNALKRRGLLGYLTVMNLFLAPFVGLLLFALLP